MHSDLIMNNLMSITSNMTNDSAAHQGVEGIVTSGRHGPLETLKTKEEIFDYYENLEKNLKQVRGEIDKLKEEAYNDLVYINQILSSDEILEIEEEETKTASTVTKHELDYDQVYLKNDEEEEAKAVKQVEDEEDEEEEDEETQYLSQPVSQQADSSQVYMTPAESWQTLQNQNSKQQVLNREDERTLKSQIDDDEDNETDLDQEDEEEEDEPTLHSNNVSYRANLESKNKENGENGILGRCSILLKEINESKKTFFFSFIKFRMLWRKSKIYLYIYFFD